MGNQFMRLEIYPNSFFKTNTDIINSDIVAIRIMIKEIKDLHLENDGVLFFNPDGFYERLKEYFREYLAELRSGDSCVREFKKRFKNLFKDEFRDHQWRLWWNCEL